MGQEKTKKLFYSLIVVAVLLYFAAMISGIPDAKCFIYDDCYIEIKTIVWVMRALFGLPMYGIMPLAVIGGVVMGGFFDSFKDEKKYGFGVGLFTYSLLTLFSAILFFIINKKAFMDATVASWLYLSSSVILLVVTFIYTTSDRETLKL